jgi:hypothetical protein
VRTQGITRKDKMAPRATLGYLVGYVASNIWRIWFPAAGTVKECRDVVFDEKIRHNSRELKPAQLAIIPEVDPWRIAMGEAETSESDISDREYETDPQEVESDHDEPSSRETHVQRPAEKLPPPTLMTPEPTPSCENTPIPAHLGPSMVPGAFPVEPPTPEARQNPPTSPIPEGVGSTQPELSPDDQLQRELLEVADDPPQPGYREYGSLAPRDISANLSETNILSGKRNRKKKAFLAMCPDDGNQEETRDGVLLAFQAAATTQQLHQRPHRDDLPPEPQSWKDLHDRPHRDGFIDAARFEIDTLKSKGTFETVPRPTDVGAEILPLKWVFNYKFDSEGLLIKYKAQICVRGDRQRITTEDKYAATLAVRTAHFAFALAAFFNLDTAQYDAVNAFLNSY